MKKYSNYKYSGVEWIGDIPKHWEVRKLKYIIEIKNGYAFDSSKYIQDGEYQIIRIGDIDKDINFDNCKYIDIKDIDEYKDFIINYNDILVALTGATIGKNTLYKYSKISLLNQRVALLRSNKLNQYFLKYFVSAYFFKIYIDYYCIGGAQENISKEDLGNFLAFIPPKTEQSQIANYLDKKTSKIDEIINDKEELIKLLEEKKEIIISNAVTKGLNPDVKMKDSGVEWIGKIPKHWEATLLKWLSNIYAGGTPNTMIKEYWQNGNIPWIASGEVNQKIITKPTNYITEEALKNSSAKWIPKNSLVMALAGQGKTKGMVAYLNINTTCNQSLSAIVPYDRINSKFLFYWLQSNYLKIRKMVGDGLRDGLNLELIGIIPVPIPSKKQEQQQIVDFLDKKTDEITQTIQTIKDEIKLLKEYKEILIYEVVTGKIDVREEVVS